MSDEPNVKQEILKLRQRLVDLQKAGIMGAESFGTYQQTCLQIWQEAERRRISLLKQADTLRTQAQAAEAQAGAFTAMSSIIYNVVNGFVLADEKRAREEADRAAEQAEKEAEAAKLEANSEFETESQGENQPKKRGRKKKAK